MSWQEQLDRHLSSCVKVAVLGAGSELCGDDAAGMLLVQRLVEAGAPPALLPLAGSTAPENFTGQIKAFRPDLLLLVDAAFVGGEIGDISLIKADQVKSVSFSTHMLPFTVMIDYLRQETGLETLILGIQPGETEFATAPCGRICSAVEELAAYLLGRFPPQAANADP